MAELSTPNKSNDLWQNELLTVKEVAGYLRVSRVTVWRWCQQGVIPAFRIGRNWRIRRDDLLNMEDCPKTERAPPPPRLQSEE
jgi:excisionase family DNA binding protein